MKEVSDQIFEKLVSSRDQSHHTSDSSKVSEAARPKLKSNRRMKFNKIEESDFQIAKASNKENNKVKSELSNSLTPNISHTPHDSVAFNLFEKLKGHKYSAALIYTFKNLESLVTDNDYLTSELTSYLSNLSEEELVNYIQELVLALR